MKAIKKHWWKALAVILLVYTMLFSFLIAAMSFSSFILSSSKFEYICNLDNFCEVIFFSVIIGE